MAENRKYRKIGERVGADAGEPMKTETPGSGANSILFREPPMNTRILRAVNAEDYGFKLADISVAALVKAYLQQISVEKAMDTLARIVNPGVRCCSGEEDRAVWSRDGIHAKDLPEELWSSIDGDELTCLIDDAKKAAAEEAAMWRAEKSERTLTWTIKYIKDELNVESREKREKREKGENQGSRESCEEYRGSRYVETMPVEMAAFITDCYLAAQRA